jgi:hypothetical protein
LWGGGNSMGLGTEDWLARLLLAASLAVVIGVTAFA